MQEPFCPVWNALDFLEFEKAGGVRHGPKGKSPGPLNETRGSSGKRDRQNES
jgi:hypothetical protein